MVIIYENIYIMAVQLVFYNKKKLFTVEVLDVQMTI